MKKQLLLCLALCISAPTYTHKLHNAMLKTIDQAGFFNRAIIDIIKVRQKIKELLHGKLTWHGAELTLKTDSPSTLTTVVKRPETLYGATFVVVSPEYHNINEFITEEHQEAVSQYLTNISQYSLLQRQEHTQYDGVFTGSYAQHPMTDAKLPVYIADYSSDLFDTRHTHIHIGIPAHISKDFAFAQKHHLPIKQVVTAQSHVSKNNQPIIRDGKLVEAYTNDDDEILIINSNTLNGTPKAAFTKALQHLETHNSGKEYKAQIIYNFNNHNYSLEQLKTVEDTLLKEHLDLSSTQKESFGVLMNYVQADLLDIVEPFLKNIHAAKDVMIELIQESCQLRNNNNCYMLKWSKLKSNESERVIFKRDITTFHSLGQFCSDLVDFLGDFASSCPVALENLKKLKNNK